MHYFSIPLSLTWTLILKSVSLIARTFLFPHRTASNPQNSWMPQQRPWRSYSDREKRDTSDVEVTLDNRIAGENYHYIVLNFHGH